MMYICTIHIMCIAQQSTLNMQVSDTYFKVPLISLTFLTLMRSLLRLCNRIIITSFFIRLTRPPLLLIAKYTHIILEMLITNRLHFCRTNIKQFTTLHLGPKRWNSLPHNLTELTSYSSFKRDSYKLNSPDHDMAAYILM